MRYVRAICSRRAVLFAGTAFLAAGSSTAVWAAEGTLRRGNRYEPSTLDPHKFNTQYEAAIVHDLFVGLVTYNADGTPQPGLAASWASSDDGRRYEFRLRRDLFWSDGTPLTAEDAVYTYRRLMDPKTAANYAQLMYVLKNGRAVNTGAMPPEALGVSAPNAQTVVLELEAPAPYLPELLANAFAVVLPRHIVPRGDQWTQPANMVSSGAFTLWEWQPQSRIVLVHNPRFYDAPESKLARVVYLPTTDLTAAVARFRAGEIDMQVDFPMSQVDMLRQTLPHETRLTPTLITYYLALNTTNPKLADMRVRRALSLAIDREILTGKVLRAGEQPAFTFVPRAVVDYDPPPVEAAAQPTEARLAEAKRLLAEAGYGPDSPLKLTYSHSANLDLRRIAVIVAGMWKRAGVETSLLNTEGKVHFANLRQGNFEAAFVGWAADVNDAANFLSVLASTSVNANYSRYHNRDFDRLLGEAAATQAVDVRADLLRQAEVLALRDQPIIPLYFGVTKSLVSHRVTGWRANALDVHPSRYLNVTR